MLKVSDNLKQNSNLDRLLDEAYDEALENEAFKELVSKLKLKRKNLKKYTSILQESSIEYNHCKNCKGLVECKNKIDGYAYLPRVNDENLEFSYRPCKYKRKFDKLNKFRENTLLFNVPKEIKEASITKIYKTDKKRFDTILWLTDFMEKYKEDKHQKGLYLCGNFGCGKTYLVASIFNELAKDNIKSAIIFWPEFLNDLKSSFNSEIKSEFRNKYNYIKKVPLLLIDDLGAESVTPWSRDEILCPLLQYRMDEKLPTFFTSNLNLDALEKHLAITSKGDEIIKAGRIVSRIKQLTCYQEMISKNLRK